MNDAFATYGFPVLAVAVLALITWGPTLLVFRLKRRGGETGNLRKLTIALLVEAVAVVALAAAADVFGLLNPGGYLLAIALVIGAAGGQIFSKMRVRHSR